MVVLGSSPLTLCSICAHLFTLFCCLVSHLFSDIGYLKGSLSVLVYLKYCSLLLFVGYVLGSSFHSSLCLQVCSV